jgi:hypothetical protein
MYFLSLNVKVGIPFHWLYVKIIDKSKRFILFNS